jgi:phospholipid-binding lipoprotein MlaA
MYKLTCDERNEKGKEMNHLMRWAGILAAAALSGCAAASDPRDPFEGFNRAMFTFNDKLDQYAVKPAATSYQKYLPTFVQTGVGNFFGNLGDAWTGVNNLLQGKGEDGVTDVMRFALNSTLGLLGVIDIASEAGMPRHKQDFGATLGTWGIGSGPYVVLPFLGPSTVRDTAGLPLDWTGNLWQRVYPVWTRNSGTAVRAVDQRAAGLNATNLIEDAALDRYAFVRDGYLQRRESKIKGSDSRPPKQDDARSMDAPRQPPDAAAGQSNGASEPNRRPMGNEGG